MTSIAGTATAATDTNRAVARLNADSLSWTIVRVATGAMLMPHGAQKLFGWYSASTTDTLGGAALQLDGGLVHLFAFPHRSSQRRPGQASRGGSRTISRSGPKKDVTDSRDFGIAAREVEVALGWRGLSD